MNHAEGTEHIPLRLDKKSTSTLSGDSNTKVSYNYEASGSHKLLLNALGANSGGKKKKNKPQVVRRAAQDMHALTHPCSVLTLATDAGSGAGKCALTLGFKT